MAPWTSTPWSYGPLAVAGVLLGSASVNTSTLQAVLQPSRLTALLSSHCSVPALMPSPHTVWQALGAPVQTQPGSTWQLALQPSPAVVLLSSQASPPTISPSPQTGPQVLGTPEQA